MQKIFFLLLISLQVLAYQKSDAFIVTAHPGYYRVLSPVKIDKKIGLIVQNKSLVKIFGRLETDNNELIKMINVKPDQSISITFDYSVNKKYFFIPLSPAFQEVELKRGETSYEVPTQRKEK